MTKASMIKALSVMVTVLGMALVMAMATGCSNSSAGCTSDSECSGQVCVSSTCVQCRADGDCNSNDACMVCSGNSCQKKADCCSSDADCKSGRCINTAGKAYGSCK